MDAMVEGVLGHDGIALAAAAMAVSFLATVVLVLFGLLERPMRRHDEFEEGS